MIDFLEKLQTEYEHISESRIGRLEPGLSADDVTAKCKSIVEDVRVHRISINELIEMYLHPLLKNATEISDEDEEALYQTAQKISSYIIKLDPGMALIIYKSLLEKARKSNDLDKTIKYLYWCGITLFYFNRKAVEETLEYFKEGASYSTQYRRIESEDTRRYIHRCLGNHHMMIFNTEKPEEAMPLEDKIFSFWNSVLFSGLDLDFPWLTYFQTCLTHKHSYLTRLVHTDPDSETKENLQRILDISITSAKLYYKNKDLFTAHGGARYEFTLWEAQFLNGLISFDQLKENVYNKQMLYADDDYSADAIHVKIYLFTFLMFYAANMRELRDIKDDFLPEAMEKVINYVSLIPKTENTGEIARQLRTFANDLGELIEPSKRMNFALELTIFRSLPTYAHSVMVGKIAKFLTENLVIQNPGCFIGCFDFENIDDVIKNPDILYEIAEKGGLYHDIGKFIYTDNPFMFARKLTEAELELVRTHPEEGYSIVKQKDTQNDMQNDCYSDIVLGHHKHYDNIGGYPESFDIAGSKYRMMIDIIKIADTIDAATDDYGKAYAPVKSLAEVCAEINEKAGSEYSPVAAELLNDPDVIAELAEIIDIGRRDAFFEAYSHAWS